MRNLPVKVTEEEVEAMVREVDRDGDGELGLDEFRIMMGI